MSLKPSGSMKLLAALSMVVPATFHPAMFYLIPFEIGAVR
jgi:hypothetical protein